jgi:hypothetical protein
MSPCTKQEMVLVEFSHMKRHPTLDLSYQENIEIQVVNAFGAFALPRLVIARRICIVAGAGA